MSDWISIISTTYYIVGTACGIFGVGMSGFNSRRDIKNLKRSEAEGVYTRHLQRDLDQIEEVLNSFRKNLFKLSNLSSEEFNNRLEKILLLNEEFVYCHMIISDALQYCSEVCPIEESNDESWVGLIDGLDPVANAMNFFQKDGLKIGEFQDEFTKSRMAICDFRVSLHSFVRKHVK